MQKRFANDLDNAITIIQPIRLMIEGKRKNLSKNNNAKFFMQISNFCNFFNESVFFLNIIIKFHKRYFLTNGMRWVYFDLPWNLWCKIIFQNYNRNCLISEVFIHIFIAFMRLLRGGGGGRFILKWSEIENRSRWRRYMIFIFVQKYSH